MVVITHHMLMSPMYSTKLEGRPLSCRLSDKVYLYSVWFINVGQCNIFLFWLLQSCWRQMISFVDGLRMTMHWNKPWVESTVLSSEFWFHFMSNMLCIILLNSSAFEKRYSLEQCYLQVVPPPHKFWRLATHSINQGWKKVTLHWVGLNNKSVIFW